MNKTLILLLPPRSGMERIPMRLAIRWSEALGFCRERADEVGTAVAEACSNAREHGRLGKERLHLSLSGREGLLCVSIRDKTAVRLDLVSIPEHDSIQRRREEHRNPQGSRGWGLYLIKAFATRCESTCTPEGHTLRLVFKAAKNSNSQERTE